MRKTVIFIIAMLFWAGAASADTPGAGEEEVRVKIENLVNEAVRLIEAGGKGALKVIGDKNGKFSTPETYVFVTSDKTGADLVNSAFLEVEGVPAKKYTGVEAKTAQMTIIYSVKDKDATWTEYEWPKPRESRPSKKKAYLKKVTVDGEVWIVGAGYYPQ